jgi:hypothetical protein
MKKLYRTIWYYFNDSFTTLWQNRIKAFRYLLIVIPATIYLGMISFIGKSSGADFFLKSLQAFAFLSAGIFHLYLLDKKISFQRLRYFGEGITFTILVGVTICLTLLFFYLFTDNSMATMAINSSMAFILPHACFHAWALYKNIPPKQYPLWTAPLNSKDVNEVLMTEIVTFRFLISSKKSDEYEKTCFRTVPGDWKLGRAFFAMLNDGQEIECVDESGNLYAWEFHRLLFMGRIKKRLDPEESVTDNMISKKSKVHVTRVSLNGDELPVIHKIQYKTFFGSEKSIHMPDIQSTVKIFESH